VLHWQDRVCDRLFVLWVLVLVLMAESSAQLATSYVDSRGQRVVFPLGELSFADEVVAFKAGSPATTRANFASPALALGPPDYVNEGRELEKPSSVALGCGGVLILKFLDNVLVDVPGPDLYVFEVGPDIEPTDLAISVDGNLWRELG
jgi:OmpA-OmpF porin, OOP family